MDEMGTILKWGMMVAGYVGRKMRFWVTKGKKIIINCMYALNELPSPSAASLSALTWGTGLNLAEFQTAPGMV